MDAIKYFKKLLVFYLFAFVIGMIISFYSDSEAVTEFNERMEPEWFNNESAMIAFFSIFFLILILHIISLFMLYKLKRNGKRIFVSTLVLLSIAVLFTGSYAFSPFGLLFEYIIYMIDGALLVFLYFTPVSKKFNDFP
tara:strand:- start:37 stop:450 length:414 start_codon:yes stop_codon:yes gene_type:complete